MMRALGATLRFPRDGPVMLPRNLGTEGGVPGNLGRLRQPTGWRFRVREVTRVILVSYMYVCVHLIDVHVSRSCVVLRPLISPHASLTTRPHPTTPSIHGEKER